MHALTLRGSFRGPSGHDHHVREFARALHRRGIRLRLLDVPQWHPLRLAPAQREPWFDSLNKPVDGRVIVHFCMPSQAKRVRRMLNVNFTMFEATRVSPYWIRCNLRHDLVVLPTPSSYGAWVDSGYPPELIRLCPLGVDGALFRPGIEPLPIHDARGRPVTDYSRRFLNVVDLAPRKNLLGLLRVWITATKPADDAVLIIKLTCGSEEWLSRFMRAIAAIERQIGKTRTHAAPIVFMINRILSDREMPRLYAAATHYVSLSCGEGWDQPMIEAAAMGLHLIAPRHSAYTAYLDDSIADLIRARTAPARFEWSDGLQDLFRGADWWEPSESDAVDCLRRALDKTDPGRNLAARRHVVENYSWDKAAARLIDILDELDSGTRSDRHRPLLRRLWSLGADR